MGQLHIRNVQQAHMGAVFRCPHALCYVLFPMKLNYASIEIMLRCKGKELILAKKLLCHHFSYSRLWKKCVFKM